jgi:hypothetical protein
VERQSNRSAPLGVLRFCDFIRFGFLNNFENYEFKNSNGNSLKPIEMANGNSYSFNYLANLRNRRSDLS